MTAYLADGASQLVTVEHLVKPASTASGNPHHFVIIEVDGSKIVEEVVALGTAPFAPFGGRARQTLND